MGGARADKGLRASATRPSGTRLRAVSTLGLVVGLALSIAASVGPAGASGAPATTLGSRVMLGAYVDGVGSDPDALPRFEQEIGRTADIASTYYGYDGQGGGGIFPNAQDLKLAADGTRKVLVGWDLGPTRFTEWTQGRHDAYLQEIADAAKSFPYRVYVRPWAEMNGDWAAYQPTAAGDRPRGGTYAEFRSAWRYVVTYLRTHGAGNLRWVFDVDAATYAGTTPIGRIWPGRAYVDVLGLDGYNWGRSAEGGAWRSFSAIFRRQYRTLTSLNPTAPVWVCEVGSKEPRVDDGAPVDGQHSKAAWIRAMFSLTSFPRIKALVWFDADKERDWRLSSSTGALRAVRNALGTR